MLYGGHKIVHLKSNSNPASSSGVPGSAAAAAAATTSRTSASGTAATGEQVAERAKAQMLRMDKSCMFAMIVLGSEEGW